MIRTVEEIRTQTEEAHENYVMEQIDKAANDRKTNVTIPCEDVPVFLAAKLRQYGYKLQHTNSLNNLIISWEV